MVQKIPKFVGGMVLGGTGIVLGSAAIGSLPTTPATAQLQQGFTTFAGFFPTIGAIGAFGVTKRQLEKIKFKKMKGGII